MVGRCFGQCLCGSRLGATLLEGRRGSPELRTSKSPSAGSCQRWKRRSSTTIEEIANCRLPVIFADSAGLCLSARLSCRAPTFRVTGGASRILRLKPPLSPVLWSGIVTAPRELSPVTFDRSNKCDRRISLARIQSRGGGRSLRGPHPLRLTNPTGLAASLHSPRVSLSVPLLAFARPHHAVLHVPEVRVSGLRSA